MHKMLKADLKFLILVVVGTFVFASLTTWSGGLIFRYGDDAVLNSITTGPMVILMVIAIFGAVGCFLFSIITIIMMINRNMQGGYKKKQSL